MRYAWRASGVTQEAIADRCAVKRAAVSQWVAEEESKSTNPTHDNLTSFADITGYDLRWLLTGKGQKIVSERHEVNEQTGPGYKTRPEFDPVLMGKCMDAVREMLTEAGIPKTDEAWTEQAVLTQAMRLYQRTEASDVSGRQQKTSAGSS